MISRAPYLVVLGLLAVGGFSVYQELHRKFLVSAEYPAPDEGMVLVPAGSFVMGTDAASAGADEKPAREVFVAAFYIDVYEVTNADYKKFDPAHEFSEGKDDYPVTGITLEQARAYAASVGKRLPTLAEWEKAARGTSKHDYPWGNDFLPAYANVAHDALKPIGSHPEGVSHYGAHDMIGNACEWVDDVKREGGFLRTGTPTITREIITGGGYSYSAYQCRISYNGYEFEGLTCNDVGFRCVKDAEAE